MPTRTLTSAGGPTSATNIADGWEDDRPAAPERSVLDWSDALERLARAQLHWLTVGSEEGPHTRPVLAVVVDGRPCIATGATARKTALLERDPTVSLATSTDDLDLVVRGTARRLTVPDDLAEVAAAYTEKYGWQARPEGDALTAPSGAPTAGPPPYLVVAITPLTAHAFGTTDRLGPRSTRWAFDPGPAPTGAAVPGPRP